MSGFKKFISRFIPTPIMNRYVSMKRNVRLRGKSAESIFTEYYHKNYWQGEESVSGPGSDLTQTSAIMNALPGLVKKYDIHTFLDIPCGDFNWMQHVPLENVTYTGADIVSELIEKNRQRFAASNRKFEHLNLIEGPLPKMDLIFVRDCFVHFSFEHIRGALKTCIASGSTYLLTTTFVSRTSNADIATGNWRPLNLQKAPFNFPAPLILIDEQSKESDGAFSDKHMGLWRLEDLKALDFLK